MNTHDAKRKIACKRTASLGQGEMPNPQRPHFLARVATLLSLLGENDKHCDLVSEAVNIAQAAGKPGNADAFSTNVIIGTSTGSLNNSHWVAQSSSIRWLIPSAQNLMGLWCKLDHASKPKARCPPRCPATWQTR